MVPENMRLVLKSRKRNSEGMDSPLIRLLQWCASPASILPVALYERRVRKSEYGQLDVNTQEKSLRILWCWHVREVKSSPLIVLQTFAMALLKILFLQQLMVNRPCLSRLPKPKKKMPLKFPMRYRLLLRKKKRFYRLAFKFLFFMIPPIPSVPA